MSRRSLIWSLLGGALALGGLFCLAPAQAAELVMFERPGCGYCARFDREVAPIYAKTEEGQRAPLRRMEMAMGFGALSGSKAEDFTLASPVRFAPTFVLVDQGREIGRITGYMSDEAFFGLLDALTRDLPPSQARTQ